MPFLLALSGIHSFGPIVGITNNTCKSCDSNWNTGQTIISWNCLSICSNMLCIYSAEVVSNIFKWLLYKSFQSFPPHYPIYIYIYMCAIFTYLCYIYIYYIYIQIYLYCNRTMVAAGQTCRDNSCMRVWASNRRESSDPFWLGVPDFSSTPSVTNTQNAQLLLLLLLPSNATRRLLDSQIL